MSQVAEKFLPLLTAGSTSNAAIAAGDSYKQALYKLQGQKDALDSRATVLERNVQGAALLDLTSAGMAYNMSQADSQCSLIVLFGPTPGCVVNFYDAPDNPVQLAIFNCSSGAITIRMSTSDSIITLPAASWTLVAYGYSQATNIAINATIADGVRGDITVSGSGSIWTLNSGVVTKTTIGLGNVDNTSDVNKPVSTAQASALAGKVANTTTVNGHALTANVTVTAADLSLGNVDNTSDINKPVSTAQATAIGLKVDKTTTVNGYALSANVTLAKGDIGLGNVDNTSDVNKPISTATQTALNAKVPTARTINTKALTADIIINATDVGLGNVDNTSDVNKPISTATQTALNAKANSALTINGYALTANITLAKSDVGLGNVDNTSDANKPISTATQTALNLKEDKTNKGAANGYAPLDSNSKVPVANLPDSVIGGVKFKGTWNANTNIITSSDGTINGLAMPAAGSAYNGWYFIVATAGSTSESGITDWKIGDWIICDGTNWQKIDNTDAVSSINGLTGVVVLTTANISDSTDKRYVTDAYLTVLSNTSGTNTGNQTITATGDVTGTSNNTTATSITLSIANSAVTLAKMANLAANSVIGNLTGSAATPVAVPATAAATASTIVTRDSNGNTAIVNLLSGYTTTATAAGTTTLTAASTYLNIFTGATTQTVVLPDVTTLSLGKEYYIKNTSTGLVTVQSSGANTVRILGPGTYCIFTCVLTTGTTAASWIADYAGSNIADGKVFTVNNNLTLSGTDGNSLSINSVGASVSGANTGDQTITLTGNVTGSGTGSFATTIAALAVATGMIANNAVTLAKMQTIATKTMLANITAGTAVPTAVGFTELGTVSTGVFRDANGVSNLPRLVNGYATTATAAGTTTLTVASVREQFFTGTNTQTIVMPAANTLTLGSTWSFTNKSTGALTINANGGSAIATVAAGCVLDVKCTYVSTTTGVWSAITPGTVTAVTVTTANGVSATVANQGTTPALTFTLGAITPTSVQMTNAGIMSIGTLSYSPSANTSKMWYTDSQNNYMQLILQNQSTGITASSDLILSTNTGTDTAEYLDLGINCAGWTGTTYGGAKDGYLVVDGGASGIGNLVIGTAQANTKVKFSIGNGLTNATAGILELLAGSATVNGNMVAANGHAFGQTSTATAAGTTTLTVSSTFYQDFTGSTTQTVVLPDATTLALGQTYIISNASTGNVTINLNGGTTQYVLSPGTAVLIKCTGIGTAAGTWIQFMMGTAFYNDIDATDYTVANTAYTSVSTNVRLTGLPAGVYLTICTLQIGMSTNNVDCWLGLHSGTAGSTTLLTGAETASRPRETNTLYPDYSYELPVTVFAVCTLVSGQIIEPKVKSSSGTATIYNSTLTALRIG